MKRNHATQVKKIFLPMAAVVVTCWNGSIVDSNNKPKRPDVNFYGELTDHLSTCKVEDILIGGKYEQIPMYQPLPIMQRSEEKKAVDQPSSKPSQIDPKQNKIMIDLQEISNIALRYPEHPIANEVDINNRKYIEIVVTTLNHDQQNYLIESTRELTCLKINQDPNDPTKKIQEERKLNMIHVKNLAIKGYKSGEDSKQRKYQQEADSSKAQVAANTEKILDQIEEKVKNLPKDDPSQYEKFKSSIVSMLRALRDQLQKLLNMIKG